MLQFTHKTTVAAELSLTLNYELRQKSRQRVKLDNGVVAGLFLERGIILRDGDCLSTDAGETVLIKAAKETVSTVHCDNALLLSRACYHLGNRHVALQVSEKFIRYQHDHVLDELCHGLGLEVICEEAAFEPESGAYGDYGHMQGHAHSHPHKSDHDH
ncbi:MAG: urease accessory protein UreE [Gammaproteobacteria bacterium]|nr:urease accessory protein UreE [Gammaproteobacteria bacterium]